MNEIEVILFYDSGPLTQRLESYLKEEGITYLAKPCDSENDQPKVLINFPKDANFPYQDSSVYGHPLQGFEDLQKQLRRVQKLRSSKEI